MERPKKAFSVRKQFQSVVNVNLSNFVKKTVGVDIDHSDHWLTPRTAIATV